MARVRMWGLGTGWKRTGKGGASTEEIDLQKESMGQTWCQKNARRKAWRPMTKKLPAKGISAAMQVSTISALAACMAAHWRPRLMSK